MTANEHPAVPDVVIEALRFYATLETYEDEFDGQDPPISMDGGHRATLALATLSTNKE